VKRIGYGNGYEASIVRRLTVMSTHLDRCPSTNPVMSVSPRNVAFSSEAGLVTLTIKRNLLQLGG